jgi:type 1 glutamine amidotransferase
MQRAIGVVAGVLMLATTWGSCAGNAATLSDARSRPLRVCMVSGSWEYNSHESLTAYKKYLEEKYNVTVTLLKAPKRDDFPGLEALNTCDVALFFTRRLEIDGEQLEHVKKYCTSGRPIVACRTASHGFQNWLEFDKLVLGGNYSGHFGRGPTTQAKIESQAKDHPILEGLSDFQSEASLYKTKPLAADCTLLMTGSTAKSEGSQPLAWTRVVKDGRVFYTSLGAPTDFANPPFQRMMANALFWAAKRKPEAR